MTETVDITVTMKAVAVTPTETVISTVTLTRDSESN